MNNDGDTGIGRVLIQDPEQAIEQFFEDAIVKDDLLVPTVQGILFAFDAVHSTDEIADAQKTALATVNKFKSGGTFPDEWTAYRKLSKTGLRKALFLNKFMNGFYASFEVVGEDLAPIGEKLPKWKPWQWFRMAMYAGCAFDLIYLAATQAQLGKAQNIEVRELEAEKND